MLIYFFLLKYSLANGQLTVAEAYGLPFLPAYKNITKSQADIKKGVNFAYAGATALEFDYFIRNGLPPPATTNSLKVQLDWFKMLKPSLCKNKEGFGVTPCILFYFFSNT